MSDAYAGCGTNAFARGPIVSTLLPRALHVPCPFCGVLHTFANPPGMQSAHCASCNYYVCAVEWRDAFAQNVAPVPTWTRTASLGDVTIEDAP